MPLTKSCVTWVSEQLDWLMNLTVWDSVTIVTLKSGSAQKATDGTTQAVFLEFQAGMLRLLA